MITASEAVIQIEDLLADRISLASFEDWSVDYLQHVHSQGDLESQKSAHLVRSALNAFEDDESEAGLRAELRAMVRPLEYEAEQLSIQAFLWGENRAANSSEISTRVPVSESNSNFAFNVAA
jgi:hypothetical protein